MTRTDEFEPALEQARNAKVAGLIEIRLEQEIISTYSTLTQLRERALSAANA